jgi:hypothetical protein
MYIACETLKIRLLAAATRQSAAFFKQKKRPAFCRKPLRPFCKVSSCQFPAKGAAAVPLVQKIIGNRFLLVVLRGADDQQAVLGVFSRLSRH